MTSNRRWEVDFKGRWLELELKCFEREKEHNGTGRVKFGRKWRAG